MASSHFFVFKRDLIADMVDCEGADEPKVKALEQLKIEYEELQVSYNKMATEFEETVKELEEKKHEIKTFSADLCKCNIKIKNYSKDLDEKDNKLGKLLT
ncbi:hypothetical protein TrCOL_g11615 [Triparma columacea]|uniref:Uncharacterized protein n=1 Tax=Triparma columacea TaxID=722753 RepID=A0A9W7GP94_9STRA|nr:hypothetical protein TrCOL_g11615 [Triparma columacea]